MVLLKMGPMGPGGLGPWALWAPGALGPTPFRLCRRALVFFQILGVPKIKRCFVMKIVVCLMVFAILANVDLNSRLTIHKITI